MMDDDDAATTSSSDNTRQIIHGVPKKTTGTPLLAMLPQKTFVPWTLSDRHIYAN